MTMQEGELIGGNYRVLRLLAQGGYAKVYLAEHLQRKEQFAIKVLDSPVDINNQDSVYNEARLLSRLSHPNIVRIIDFGIIGDNNYNLQHGHPYVVMTYASKGTLRNLYPKGTQVPLRQIVNYVNQVANALQYAHERNIIHRDIKPENMLVVTDNQILLSDFGIATTALSVITPIEIPGTFPYASPESMNGNFSAASDQYSLGIVVYEWLTGSCPFTGSMTEIINGHTNKQPPPLTGRGLDIPNGIEQVVMKALNKKPEERYPTVRDFANALESEERASAMSSGQYPDPYKSNVPSVPSPFIGNPPPYGTSPTQPDTNRTNVYREIQVLPPEEQKEVIIRAFGSLSVKDRNDIVQEMGVRSISQKATDFIWQVVVTGAVIVFVGSAIGVGIAVFVGVNVAPLITVFTAVIAFLGGLLAPSPVQNAIRAVSSSFKSSSKAGKE